MNDELLSEDQSVLKNLHDEIIDEILYLQDLFSLKVDKINYILTNCIFYFLVLPLLCGSLISMTKPKIAISVSMYVMVAIFNYVKDEAFLNLFFAVLFYEKLNKKLIRYIENYPKNIRNYYYDWNAQKKGNYTSFTSYISSNFSENFIKSLIFVTDSPYPEINAVVKKFDKLCEENPNINSSGNYFQMLLEDVLGKFSNSEIDIMTTFHKNVSIATGMNVGLTTTDHKRDSVIRVAERMFAKSKVF
jgi:hypothetical protein